jgi:hypothetical protein
LSTESRHLSSQALTDGSDSPQRLGGGSEPSSAPSWMEQVSLLADTESLLADSKSSLGDAKSPLGDAKSSLEDAKSRWVTLSARWVTFTDQPRATCYTTAWSPAQPQREPRLDIGDAPTSWMCAAEAERRSERGRPRR